MRSRQHASGDVDIDHMVPLAEAWRSYHLTPQSTEKSTYVPISNL